MDETNSDLEAIRQVKARYFRFLDTKEWKSWRELFTDDLVQTSDTAVSTRGADGKPARTYRSADTFVAEMQPLLDELITTHHGHMPEIQITSPTEARGIWAMEDIVEWPDGRILRGYGHYHETYRKEGDDWKIASSHLTRVRIDLSGPWEG